MSQTKCSATPRLVLRKKNKNKKEKLKKKEKIQKTQTHFSNNLQLVLIVRSTLIFLKYITSSIESSQRVHTEHVFSPCFAPDNFGGVLQEEFFI